MKKLIIILLFPTLAFSQVGIKTDKPKATLDVNGNLRVRQIPTGTSNDSILVVNNGFVRKIALSSITQPQNGGTCPNFVKNQSSGYYLLFKSSGSIQSPNNPLTINNLPFVSAGTWIQSNTYYYSYSGTSGQSLNINNFTVQFGSLTCVYN